MRQLLFLLIALLLGACSEDVLDTQPRTQKVDANFYQTPQEANMALAAIYRTLLTEDTHSSFFHASELMSDHRFGGGRKDNPTYNSLNMFKLRDNDPNSFLPAWAVYYKGIFRANMLINRFEQIEWSNNEEKNQVLGEVHFLRAYIYFDLARMFERVPLIIEPVVEDLPQAEPEETYAQIAADLKKAIEAMPSAHISNIPSSRAGNATKWAAQGLMARVFLFYTGFYNKETLPLPDGGEVSKNQVIAWLEDCIENSGHALIADFRNLWPYAYANENYGYAKEHGLDWIGEEGANTETVFAFKFNNYAVHDDNKKFYSNQNALFFGMRGISTIPFGTGWGAGTVNPQLWEMWPDEDIRKKGSIFNANPDWGDTELDWFYDYAYNKDDSIWVNVGYRYGGGPGNQQWQESGMWQKKYMPINVRFDVTLDENGDTTRMVPVGYSVEKYGTESDYQLENTQDLVMIRFADILLMASELMEDATYMNIVRDRAGLPSLPFSHENIRNERTWELSFECVRYWDILRWGIAEIEFAKVKDVPVYDDGVPSTTTIVFRPETRGFLYIPQSEIDKSDGVLIQNPGWDTPEAFF